MNLIDCVTNFITWLRINRNASPKTIEQYSFHLWSFIHYLDFELTKAIDWKFLLLASPQEPNRIKDRKRELQMLKQSFDWMIADIDLDLINDFRFSLDGKGLNIKTVNAYMISLRTFFKYLKKQ